MPTYTAYYSCGHRVEVEAPGLLKAIKTAQEYKSARRRAIGDFFTVAPTGVTVAVPHIRPITATGPQQLELRFGTINKIQYSEGV